jgi:hypothetical protein
MNFPWLNKVDLFIHGKPKKTGENEAFGLDVYTRAVRARFLGNWKK